MAVAGDELLVLATTSALSAFFGAAASIVAVSAHEHENSILNEIQILNKSQVVTTSIFSHAITLKSSFLSDIFLEYQRSRRTAALDCARRTLSPERNRIHFSPNLIKIEDLPLRNRDTLSSNLGSISAPPLRILGCFQIIDRSISEFNKANRIRSELIENIFQILEATPLKAHHLYYGFRHLSKNGISCNDNFRSCLDTMAQCLDDTIFFAHIMSKEIEAHAKHLRKRLLVSNPKIITSQPSEPLLQNMMPTPSKYQYFFDTYPTPPRNEGFFSKLTRTV